MKSLVIVAALAAAAHADPASQAKADKLFEQAQADYQAGKYAEAIPLFQRAYDLVHDPVYLFNIAQSSRKIADCEQATAYYKRYLEESPKAENRAKVEQWIGELKPCVDRLQAEREAARQAAEQQRKDEELRKPVVQPAPAPIPAREGDAGGTYRTAGLVVGGAGAVGLIVGALYTWKSSSIHSQVTTACTPTCVWDNEVSLDSDGKTANTIATVGWIGGGIALAAGAALYWVGHAKIEHVTVEPTPGGAAVGAWLRF